MYVRWKTKKLTGTRKSSGEQSMYAVLVASERRNGQPRQKVIKHLGFINEGQLASVEGRARFWRQVDRALATVPIDPAVRAKLERKLQEVVPAPAYVAALGLVGVPRDEQGRFLVISEMLPTFEELIDWRGEFNQLAGGWVELQDNKHHCYVISHDIFSRMGPMTQSLIRAKITYRHVQKSLDSLHRIKQEIRRVKKSTDGARTKSLDSLHRIKREIRRVKKSTDGAR